MRESRSNGPTTTIYYSGNTLVDQCLETCEKMCFDQIIVSVAILCNITQVFVIMETPPCRYGLVEHGWLNRPERPVINRYKTGQPVLLLTLPLMRFR